MDNFLHRKVKFANEFLGGIAFDYTALWETFQKLFKTLTGVDEDFTQKTLEDYKRGLEELKHDPLRVEKERINAQITIECLANRVEILSKERAFWMDIAYHLNIGLRATSKEIGLPGGEDQAGFVPSGTTLQ